MASRAKECLCWFVSIPFVLLTVISLLGLVGLGTTSIIFAQIDDERFDDAVDDSNNNFNHLWKFIMAGASVAAIPYSVFGAIAISLLINAIKLTRARKRSHSNPHKPSITSTDSATNITVKHGHAEGVIDIISGEPLYHFNGAVLATPSFPAMIVVFFSLLTSSLAVLGILWGIAIAYNNARVVDKDVSVYIIVEVIVGLFTPIMSIIAASTFSIFLEYVTQGSLDARVIITRLLPVVKLVKGIRKQYWVIENRFYFEINKLDVFSRQDEPKDDDNAADDDDNDDEPVPCTKYCSRSPSTWILTIIVSLAFLLAISYFMNQNVSQQITVKSCPHESVEIDCFNRSTYEYIDCANPEVRNDTFELLHCFRFLRFGRDSDVIGGVSRSIAFYLATLAFFTSAFHVANILINFLPTKLWGVGFIVLSVLLVGAGLIIMLTGDAVLLRIDIIQIFQVYMVAVFVFLIGLLLVIGNWWEKIGESGKGKSKGSTAHGIELERFTGIGTTCGEAKKVKKDLDSKV